MSSFSFFIIFQKMNIFSYVDKFCMQVYYNCDVATNPTTNILEFDKKYFLNIS